MSRHSNKKLTYEEVKARFELNGDILLSSYYINAESKLDYICACGNKTQTTLGSYNKIKSCKACKYNARFTLTKAKDIFAEKGCVLLATEYINNYTKMDYVCSCGHKAVTTLAMIVQGHLCSYCGHSRSIKNSTKYTLKSIQDCYAKHGHTILRYYGLGSKVVYKCSCGNIVTRTVDATSLYSVRSCNSCREHKQQLNPSRNNSQYIKWRREVLKRDFGTCDICQCINNPHVHHIESFKLNLSLRYSLANGITLCNYCHREFHRLYGRYTTSSMYKEYKEKKLC